MVKSCDGWFSYSKLCQWLLECVFIVATWWKVVRLNQFLFKAFHHCCMVKKLWWLIQLLFKALSVVVGVYFHHCYMVKNCVAESAVIQSFSSLLYGEKAVMADSVVIQNFVSGCWSVFLSLLHCEKLWWLIHLSFNALSVVVEVFSLLLHGEKLWWLTQLLFNALSSCWSVFIVVAW